MTASKGPCTFNAKHQNHRCFVLLCTLVLIYYCVFRNLKVGSLYAPSKCCQYFTYLSFYMFCRKEVKDPDVLYNMLKNLLAQIKVRVTC